MKGKSKQQTKLVAIICMTVFLYVLMGLPSLSRAVLCYKDADRDTY